MVEECSSGVDGKYLKRCSIFERGMILSAMGYDYWVKLNCVRSILTLPGEEKQLCMKFVWVSKRGTS